MLSGYSVIAGNAVQLGNVVELLPINAVARITTTFVVTSAEKSHVKPRR